MFCCCQCCLSELMNAEAHRKVTLVVVGLDNAGKTTIIRGLQGENLCDQAPVDGVSVAELCLGGCKVTLYDLGGGPGWLGRAMLGSYYAQSHGLVFVVDSSDVKRLQDTRATITDVLQHPHIACKPVLLLANKQDLSGALGEVELIHRLSLEKLVNRHQCRCLIDERLREERKERLGERKEVKRG
ncbi:hypothetical protein J4Q44_G00147340 [Coregonus suidteri]|uniref:ADP-ribosylation factor-like protein 13B n=1 Tax=Coregonus suidteri TaxID=861788 RepID=A0AAN8LZ25_9TELE